MGAKEGWFSAAREQEGTDRSLFLFPPTISMVLIVLGRVSLVIPKTAEGWPPIHLSLPPCSAVLKKDPGSRPDCPSSEERHILGHFPAPSWLPPTPPKPLF